MVWAATSTMPRPTPPPDAAARSYRRRTPEEVREILLSPLPAIAMAKRYGCSKQAISLIRTGQAYGDLFPEIPRRSATTLGPLSCLDCVNWRGGESPCAEGQPDASEKDPGFANYCEFYAALG